MNKYLLKQSNNLKSPTKRPKKSHIIKLCMHGYKLKPKDLADYFLNPNYAIEISNV